MDYVSPLDPLADHSCTLCLLHEYTERVCVMGSGDPKSRIMILGEAPGGNEARTGRVFSGRAGQLLDAALEAAGLDRDSVYVSNVVKCRPPENRTPEKAEWEACSIFLRRELKEVDPTHILLLGNTALRAVARKSGITKHRGVRLDVKDLDPRRTVMATIHPAYVLRNPGQQAVFTEDVRRFARSISGEFQVVPVKGKLVMTLEGLKKLKERLDQAETISYDVENRGRPWEPEWSVIVLGVTVDGATSYVVPLDHPESPFRDRWKKVLRYLAPSLQRAKLVGQNAKHDNVQLAGAGVFLKHNFDLMLAAHLLDENRPKNLGFLAQTLLGADVYKGSVELKPDKIMKVPLRDLSLYNAYDVGYTHQIYPRLKKELLKEPRLTRLFAKLLMPASHVIQEVEYVGMYVNPERLWDRIKELEVMIRDQRSILEEHLGDEHQGLNYRSPQQLGRWLFSSASKGGLGLSPLESTKTGRPSTREAVLLHYGGHPAVAALLRLRTLEGKWMRTYLAPWSLRLDERSRLHTTYKIYGTTTGRLSGDMQQVPRDPFIRGVIGAPPGWLFVEADFSQIELRIAAHCAGERRMKRAFILNEDLHLVTASDLVGRPPDQITSEERKKAKAVNFGFLYGMYPRKFQAYAFESYGLEVTQGEAELARQKYFEMFPDLLAWHDRQERVVKQLHRVQSPIGRIRHLPDVLSSDRGVQMEAVRQAINSPVQSMASDMMLFSMVQLHDLLDPNEAFMVGTLHDAVFFEVKEDKVDKWLPVIKEVMETLPLKRTFGCELSVPIVAEVSAGQHWGEKDMVV